MERKSRESGFLVNYQDILQSFCEKKTQSGIGTQIQRSMEQIEKYRELKNDLCELNKF